MAHAAGPLLRTGAPSLRAEATVVRADRGQAAVPMPARRRGRVPTPPDGLTSARRGVLARTRTARRAPPACGLGGLADRDDDDQPFRTLPTEQEKARP